MVTNDSVATAGSYSATLQPQTQVVVAFKVGGYVRAIAQTKDKAGRQRLIQAGDPVHRGELLAQVRETDYAARSLELQGLLEQYRASTTQAKLDLDRANGLLPKGVIPQAEYEVIKAKYDALVGTTDAAQARVTEAQIALEDTQLRSPLDGVVLNRAIEVGTLVIGGTPGFSVADTRTMKANFAVADVTARSIALGDAITVSTEAIPGRTFTATVTKVAAEADPKTRLFDIEATAANDDSSLKAGMVASVRISATTTGAPRTLVPIGAVVRPPGESTGFAVYVAASAVGGRGVASMRRVSVDGLVRNQVVVTNGIAPGDAVIVQGATLVHDNDPVSIVP